MGCKNLNFWLGDVFEISSFEDTKAVSNGNVRWISGETACFNSGYNILDIVSYFQMYHLVVELH
jgi:hypothetical protein